MEKIISKSKYMNGLQCPVLLWTVVNDPEKMPQTDMVGQFRLDQGNEVGIFAQKLFPKSIEVPLDSGSVDLTKNLIPAIRA